MFVIPITKQHLRFTCACFDCKNTSTNFKLYNPVTL